MGAFEVTRSVTVFDARRYAATSRLTLTLAEPPAAATLTPQAPSTGRATLRLEGHCTGTLSGLLGELIESGNGGLIAFNG